MEGFSLSPSFRIRKASEYNICRAKKYITLFASECRNGTEETVLGASFVFFFWISLYSGTKAGRKRGYSSRKYEDQRGYLGLEVEGVPFTT